jgi:hypothetical protein
MAAAKKNDVTATVDKVMSGFTPSGASGKAFSSAASTKDSTAAYSALMVTSITQGLQGNPTLGKSAKAMSKGLPPVTVDGDPKGWFDVVMRGVEIALPLVQQLFGNKDFRPAKSAQEIAADLPRNVRADDKFWGFIAQALITVAPIVVDLITGDKAFATADLKDFPDVPDDVPKGWLDEAIGTICQLIPVVLAEYQND